MDVANILVNSGVDFSFFTVCIFSLSLIVKFIKGTIMLKRRLLNHLTELSLRHSLEVLLLRLSKFIQGPQILCSSLGIGATWRGRSKTMPPLGR